MAFEGIEVLYFCKQSELAILKEMVAILGAIYDIRGEGTLIVEPFFVGAFLKPKDGPCVASVTALEASKISDQYKAYRGKIEGKVLEGDDAHISVCISKDGGKFNEEFHFQGPFRK